MNSFEANKMFSSLLVALVVSMVGHLAGHSLVRPVNAGKVVITIDGVPESQSATAAPQGPEDLEPFMATADPARGAQIFNQCKQCHTTAQGEPHRIGPNLSGVVEGPMASKEGYAYSRNMSQKKGETWSLSNLNHFLYKPQSFVSGTKMTFVGLKKAQDRADVVTYLQKGGH